MPLQLITCTHRSQVPFLRLNANQWKLLLHGHLRGGVFRQAGRHEPKVLLRGESIPCCLPLTCSPIPRPLSPLAVHVGSPTEVQHI